MNLTEALNSTTKARRNGGRCKLAKTLASMGDTDQVRIETVLANVEEWPAPRITQALQLADIYVSASLIRQHRAGICSCYIRA